MNDKLVLVTGGTGFVAGWCIVELLRRGFRVRTTLRNLNKCKDVEKSILFGLGLYNENVIKTKS